MPLDIVAGAQWGDEGKGRAVDLLSEKADIVARFNGGDNAGHTVTVDKAVYKLHVIPSGIIHPQTIGVLGSGMVLNPQTFVDEIQLLRKAGVEITPDRLWVSDAVQLITPAHRLLDRAQDAALGKAQIGTTGRGIGPAYVDKASRRGLRAGEILDAEFFADHVKAHFEEVNRLLTDWYHQPGMAVDALITEYLGFAEQMRPYIRRIGPLLQNALDQGQHHPGRRRAGDAAGCGAGHLSFRHQLLHHLGRRFQRAGAGGAGGPHGHRRDQSLPDARGRRAFPHRAGRRTGAVPARHRREPLG